MFNFEAIILTEIGLPTLRTDVVDLSRENWGTVVSELRFYRRDERYDGSGNKEISKNSSAVPRKQSLANNISRGGLGIEKSGWQSGKKIDPN